MAKRTWRWVTRDAPLGRGTVCIWRSAKPPILDSALGRWEGEDYVLPVDGASDIEYGVWNAIFRCPLKPGEIKKVRFTCEVL